MHKSNPTTVWSVQTNPKKGDKKERQVRRAKEKEGNKERRTKPPTPNWEIDVLIGDEEPIGKQKKR